MKTLTISIESIDSLKRRILAATAKGKKDGYRYSFPSVEAFSRTLTPTRWAIIDAMAGSGPMSIRELSRRIDRDVKGVHTDVQALLNAGILDRDDDEIVFPYDTVHVDFTVKPAHAAA